MKWRAFTLIELLVVIGIIALLTAILIPSLRTARQHARAASCKSNVRQLILGITIYETEHETFPYSFDTAHTAPPPGGYPGNMSLDRTGWWWFNYIGCSKEDSVIRCHSRNIKDIILKDNMLYGNYGVNQTVCKSSHGRESQAEFVGKPLCSSNITHPGRTLLVVDSGYSMINWWHVTDAPPEPPGSGMEDTAYIPGLRINDEKNLWPGRKEDADYGRHPNKTVNIGFSDGHVSREKADYLFVEKSEETYKNKYPLWVPE